VNIQGSAVNLDNSALVPFPDGYESREPAAQLHARPATRAAPPPRSAPASVATSSAWASSGTCCRTDLPYAARVTLISDDRGTVFLVAVVMDGTLRVTIRLLITSMLDQRVAAASPVPGDPSETG
jgi:hypothetical protein